MALDAELKTTLLNTAHWLADTNDPWWVLGSAAIALLGIDPRSIGDIDVLVSERDALALMKRRSLKNHSDGGTDKFRSNIFVLPILGKRRVEVMAGYKICLANEWKPIWPKTRNPVDISGTSLWVPDAAEQIELLRMLNRPKDLERVELIERAI